METGLRDFPLIEPEQAPNGPFVIVFTENNRPIGAVKFGVFLFGQSSIFKFTEVVDSNCQPLNSYMPLGQQEDKDTLQNWDDMCFQIEGSHYSLRLSWDSESHLGADFKRLSSNSDPPLSECQDAISQGQG